MHHLLGDIAAVHDERVGGGQDEERRRAFDVGAVDADRAVVGARDEPGADGVHAPAAGDDAEAEPDRREPARDAVRSGPEPRPRRAEERPEQIRIGERVDDLAAPVRRAQHHHASLVRLGPFREVAPHEDAAHRVGDEMHGPGVVPAAFRDRVGQSVDQRFDRLGSRGVTEPDDPEPRLLEAAGENRHRRRAPAQAMGQEDRGCAFGRGPFAQESVAEAGRSREQAGGKQQSQPPPACRPAPVSR